MLRYSRFTYVENTISNSPKVTRAKFLGSNGLFCFISICKFGSFKNPFATITSLSELYFRIRRFIFLVQMKKVISMNYGSSTSSWKPKTLRWMRLDLILMMSYKNINSNLNPLKKITSSSWRTKSKDILPWNISQMIIKMEQSAVKLAEDAFNPEILDEFVKVLKYPSIKDVMVACNLMLQVFPCFNGDVEKLSLHFF